MRPVDGIVGPGIEANEINLDLPACIHTQTPAEREEVVAFLDTIVRATTRNAVRVLRAMLAPTPGAEQLASDFAARLDVK